MTSVGSARTAKVIGLRTRGSNQVRWAKWKGDTPVVPGQWVRLLDNGELGRVVVEAGMAVGMEATDSLSYVSAVSEEDSIPDDMVELPIESAWGRIGHRLVAANNEPTGDAASPESSRYRRLKEVMPALGSRIDTDDGGRNISGVVIASDAIAGKISVSLDALSEVIELTCRSRSPAEPQDTSSSEVADGQPD